VLPYVWLSLAIVCLWLRPQASAYALTGLTLSAGWLLLAIAHAYEAGIVSPLGVLVLVAFGFLCHRYWHDRAPLTLAVTILFSLALMAHVVPDFSTVLVVKDVRVGPNGCAVFVVVQFRQGADRSAA
jgi:hypothetical protein